MRKRGDESLSAPMRLQSLDMTIKLLLTTLVLGLWLVACNNVTPSPGGPPSSGMTQTPPPAQSDSATAAPSPVVAGLKILSPEDGAIVNTPHVEVKGEALPDTVITINDEIVVAGADGKFSMTLPLEEGLNEILIVASDAEGNEVSIELSVTYEPEA
jgi:hypothetical protein